ncbi:MAG: NB-ARC domain-containing protein [Cyanobacteria bacterium J06592_8]
MTFEEALSTLEQSLPPQTLSVIDILILQNTWEGKGYPEIAETLGYNPDYIKRVGSQLWQTLSEVLGEKVTKRNISILLEQQFNQSLSQKSSSTQQDWGEAVDVSQFYGRDAEIHQLKQWILEDKCRWIGILGIGGIGKTTLAIKTAQQVQHQFDYVIWRSLRNSPTLKSLLKELVSFLSSHLLERPNIRSLITCLSESRCLLILDNLESLLQPGSLGQYHSGYEAYDELFHLIGETSHQSCLLITSREKSPVLAKLSTPDSKVRSLQIQGASEITQALLQTKGLSATPKSLQELGQYYNHNPLLLKLIAASIEELFEGNIATFLAQEARIFNGIRYIFDEQFQRLTSLEKSIMFWLAINRKWTSIAQLKEDLASGITIAQLLEALEALSWRNLIEKKSGCYTLQSLVMEYMSDRLIEVVYQDFISGIINPASVLNNYALIKTTVESHVQDSQIRLILKPIVRRIQEYFITIDAIEQQILLILHNLRESALSGYGCGNLINLCRELSIDLTNYDFSHLAIWQANLQGINLQQVNFSHANFDHSVFTQSFGIILSVAFSPDGTQLATGNSNGEIDFYHLAEMQQSHLTCCGHLGRIICVRWSPDGKILASGGVDQSVKFWDVQTGEHLKTLQKHNNIVMSVAWSPDGKQIATGSDDGSIRLWNWQTQEEVNVLLGHKSGVRSVCFSPDGKILASGSEDCTIRLWDLQTGKILKILSSHTHAIWTVIFHPLGKILASAGEDHQIKIWDVHSGQEQQNWNGHSRWVLSIAWSPDGKVLASSSLDRTIRFWDTQTGKTLKILHGHAYGIWSVAWHPHQPRLASGGEDPVVKIWDTKTAKALNTIQGYTNGVRSVAFQPQAENNHFPLLASCSDDYLIRVWQPQTGTVVQRLQGHHRLCSIAWSPDGKSLASGGDDRILKLWNIQTGKIIRTFRGHTDRIWSVSWSHKEPYLASGSMDCTIKLWNIQTGQLHKTYKGHSDEVSAICLSPVESIIASGSEDRTIKFWDISTGELLRTWQAHTERINSVQFSPDGQLLASASLDKTVRIWDVKTRELLHHLDEHTNRVWIAKFSPDGQILASAGIDQIICLWFVKTGKLLNILKGHQSIIWSLSWSWDSRTLVSGSDDETIKIWEIETGQCLQTFTGDRPYAGMKIAGVTGLTEIQKGNLKILGALDD